MEQIDPYKEMKELICQCGAKDCFKFIGTTGSVWKYQCLKCFKIIIGK